MLGEDIAEGLGVSTSPRAVLRGKCDLATPPWGPPVAASMAEGRAEQRAEVRQGQRTRRITAQRLGPGVTAQVAEPPGSAGTADAPASRLWGKPLAALGFQHRICVQRNGTSSSIHPFIHSSPEDVFPIDF